MFFMRSDAGKRGVSGRVAAVVVAAATLVGMSHQAEARRRSGGGYTPPYASIVVDAKTGKVLQATNPDALRHPASVTKVMTLYMLFEALERGRFTLDSDLKITAHAAKQAPSKLGLRPGETISVEEAIKAVVTKSANDIAAAIAENVGGSEEKFAEMMTDKAHSIGMTRSNFANASGLPNPEQVTTARDLALLGRAIQDRFPKYYHYFGTRVFTYEGANYRNHNHLLGRVEGVDGIKTGYTHASGFNLLTSAKVDGKHIITVVLGGRSGRERDRQVASLVEEHMPRAYAGARQTPKVVEVAQVDEEEKDVAIERPRAVISAAKPVALASVTQPVAAPNIPAPVARPRPAVVNETLARGGAGETPVRIGQPMALAANGARSTMAAPMALAATTPTMMRWNVGAQPVRTAEGRVIPPGNVRFTNSVDGAVDTGDLGQPMPGAPQNIASNINATMDPATTSVAETPKSAVVPVVTASTPVVTPAPVAAATVKPAGAVQVAAAVTTPPSKPVVSAPVVVAAAQPAPSAVAPKLSVGSSTEVQKARAGWIIQLGATDDEAKARAIIDKAKHSNPRILAEAESFTEKVHKGDATLFRARFGGFDQSDEANAACKALKKSGFNCIAQRI